MLLQPMYLKKKMQLIVKGRDKISYGSILISQPQNIIIICNKVEFQNTRTHAPPHTHTQNFDQSTRTHHYNMQ